MTIMIEKDFTTNFYGCKIVKCCASCAFENQLTDQQRLCASGEGCVSPHYLCPNWQMRDSLQNAGKGGGKIKKKSYLMLVANTISEEQARYEQIPKHLRANFPWSSAAEIRRKYEKEQGTVYMDI